MAPGEGCGISHTVDEPRCHTLLPGLVQVESQHCAAGLRLCPFNDESLVLSGSPPEHRPSFTSSWRLIFSSSLIML